MTALRLRGFDIHKEFLGRAAQQEVLDAVPIDQALIAREKLNNVCAALEELPHNVRATFRRHKFDGLSYAEVAAEQGVSRSLVEKHMMRALKHLLERVGR